jgi:hypothetical protein
MTQRITTARRLPALLVPAALLGASLLMLSACGGAGDDIAKNIGLERDAPDEFTVTTRAPLSMPPSFALVAPTPGAVRPQERSVRDSAELALSPQSITATQSAKRSTGEQALLGAAGPKTDSSVRAEVNEQAAQDANKRGFTDRLMFWKSAPQPGVVVDPQREAQRLRQNDALGQAPTAGDTPIIQPNKRNGLLDRLF